MNSLANANNIPVMGDALRFDHWPKETEKPATNEYAAWGSNNMGRICINRHRGFTSSSFLDWSVRKVGLKELYTLQWHKKFNTRGPWTMPAGSGTRIGRTGSSRSKTIDKRVSSASRPLRRALAV